MNETSIQKYLLKSKCIATFSRYKAGKLFYEVQIEDSVYEFPIDTVEETKFVTTDPNSLVPHAYEINKDEDLSSYHTSHFDELNIVNLVNPEKEVRTIRLSSDLGETNFEASIKGSELNRWIKKAFKNGELKLSLK